MQISFQPVPSRPAPTPVNLTEALLGRRIRFPSISKRARKKSSYSTTVGLANEERELIQALQNGSNEAAEFLINKYQRFIDKMVIACGKLLTDENRNSGRIGFWIGLKRYDLERNVALMTYTGHWVKAAVYRANRLLSSEINLAKKTRSYDSLKYPDLLLGYKYEMHEELDVVDFLNSLRLDDKDKKILEMRVAGYSLKEIGHAFGISRERIRQRIEKQGFSKNFLAAYATHLNSPRYQKEVSEILRMIELGINLPEIAKALNITLAAIKRDLLIVSCAKDFFTHLRINKIQKMLEMNYSVEEIVEALNVSRGLVLRYQRLLLVEIKKINKV